MTQFIFANNVNTTLFSAAASGATTITLLSATNLPTLSSGQVFPLTLNDASTRTVFEIVYVTAIIGTTLTVLRGQEGTAAQNWNAGDYAFGTITAQAHELSIQAGAYNYAIDTGTTANAYVVTLTPGIPATIPDGFPFTMSTARPNTGPATINGFAVLDRDGNPVSPYAIDGRNNFEWWASKNSWVLINPTTDVPFITFAKFGIVPGVGIDNTTKLQNAVNALQGSGIDLVAPPGVPGLAGMVMTTAPINISATLTIRGSGAAPYSNSGPYNNPGAGSYLYFNHTGVGLNFTPPASGMISGARLSRIGTYRNQPAAGAGFTPNANSWDIDLNNTDMFMDDVVLLNPTLGINLTNGNAGRLDINRLRGHPLTQGINIDTSYDTCRLNNIHFWPFWWNDSTINSWTQANLVALQMLRCDNPIIQSFFSFYPKYGVIFGSNANGFTQRAMLSDCGIDGFGAAAILASSGANGTTFAIDNIYGYASTIAGNQGIVVNANNVFGQISNPRFTQVQSSAFSVNGTGNILMLDGNVIVDGYNVQNVSSPAVYAATGNTVKIANQMTLTGGNGAPEINSVSTVDYNRRYVAYGVLAATTTSIAISHSAGVVPTIDQVDLRTTTPIYGAGHLYVSATSATTITVTSDAAPTAAVGINAIINLKTS